MAFRSFKKLLPIKFHYFFFMAANGPILPFIPVIAKQLGINELTVGSINGILPLLNLLMKPLFGFIIDLFHKWRKVLFILLLMSTTVCYTMLVFVQKSDVRFTVDISNITEMEGLNFSSNEETYSTPINENSLFATIKFWIFVALITFGSIFYNVSNSISDAICFDILGDGQEVLYGKQRVWGTVGFGITALIGGYLIEESTTGNYSDYTLAFILSNICIVIDFLCCTIKLELPRLPQSENILKDVGQLIRQPHIMTFLIFTTFIGVIDSSIIFFLFWYLEDLNDNIGKIKLLEGLIVAAETLFGEVIFFTISNKIITKIGYINSLTLCFFSYFVRLILIGIIPSAWWALPIELFMQGPTYALGYTTIVAYASKISPPGTSATMQGLVAGVDDGFGYAIGSFIGGLIYTKLGGCYVFIIYGILAFICCLLHHCLYRFLFKDVESSDNPKIENSLAIQELKLLNVKVP